MPLPTLSDRELLAQSKGTVRLLAEELEAGGDPQDISRRMHAGADYLEEAMTTYPHTDGDCIVIGPECFAAADGSVLCWRGVNYIPQDTDRLRITELLAELRKDPDSYGWVIEWLGRASEVDDERDRYHVALVLIGEITTEDAIREIVTAALGTAFGSEQ